MPTPSKPISVIKQQGNRRRLSKKAIEHREKEEKNLTTGYSFKEWASVKNNINSHNEFVRLKKIFKKIQKDDALHESIMNRFCLLHAECIEFENMAEKIMANINDLESTWKEKKIEYIDYINAKNSLLDNYMKCDKKIMEKRKAMLDIEKENIMTIAGALRSIPKKPIEENNVDPMAAYLK